MNILQDFHHSGLAYASHLLLEKRLHHKLYFSIGMEWYEKGFWNIYPSEATARQYLEMGSQPTDGTPPLTISGGSCPPPLKIWDFHHKYMRNAIYLSQFEDMPIDVVIASIPQHIKPFKELAKMKNAKFIMQMGNVFDEVNLHEIPNLMTNTLPDNIPLSCNAVQYIQEFPLDIFKPSTMTPERLITSFINVYDHNGGYENFMSLKALMPSWTFRSYGGQCIDGTITGIENIASIMQKSAWGFHVKSGADGMGLILFNWFAVGKPVIINYEEYRTRIGGKLLIPDETCLVVEAGQDMQEVAKTIENMPPHQYEWMCTRVKEQFDKVVNFDEDELKIKTFLDNLN